MMSSKEKYYLNHVRIYLVRELNAVSYGFEENTSDFQEKSVFFSTFDQEPISAGPTLKEGRVTFSNPIPGTKWGYYGMYQKIT